MIAELLKNDEGKTLEFKRDLSSSKNLLKTLVAFANTAGGKLVVGVGDDRSVIGVENPLDEEQRLCNLIADSISPRLVPNIEMATVDGRTLLVSEVFLSNSRPHFINSEGPEAGVYVRLGSTNRQADRELIAELRRSVEGVSFDELPMVELTMDDLAIETIKRVFFGIREVDTPQTLLTLKLLRREQGNIVPTRGGILLFGRDREFHFPDCWVQCGRFIGRDKARIFDHIELQEPLPLLVDSIMLFLKKHAMRGADFSEIRRKDIWNIPLEPLREAVINALVHADYSQRGGPVRVAFFDDRIEIENPGILPPGMTVVDMLQGVSKIRNPVIARLFRELKLIEQWGSGVPRIFRETAEHGFPEPSIIELGLRLRLVFPLAETMEIVSVQSESQSPTQSPTQSSDPVARLLQALAEGPLSSGELRGRLNLKHRPTFRDNYLRPALEAGYIEMTIPEKPSSRLQKYRVTTRGKEILDETAAR
jgi:ATP-dependent DNA helicase RecG